MAVTSSVDAAMAPGGPRPSGAPASSEPAAPAQPETPGVFAEVSRLAASVRETFSSFLDLVTLEAQRAGVTLVWMLAGGVAAALLAVTAWLALVVALAMWVVSLGFPPIGAVLAIGLFSVGVAGGLFYLCLARSRALLFPATRRQLAPNPPAQPAPNPPAQAPAS